MNPLLTKEGAGGGRGAVSRWTWAAAGLVLLAAVLPRVWEISRVPRYVHCDEGTISFAAQAFYANPDRDWFAPPPNSGSYTIMNLHYALDGIGPLIGGLSLTSARASDVLLGILSVLLLFDGLRRVASLPVALVGALLLAGNHCHIAYSRIASGYIQTAFVVALEFAVCSRMWTRPTYLNAVALGVIAALGVQTYPASLVSLPLLLAAIGLQLLLHKERRHVMLVPIAIFLISGIAAGAPFGVTAWKQNAALFTRSREINIFYPPMMEGLKRTVYHTDSSLVVVSRQAWNALTGFHRGHDHQPQYGIDQPMADRYTAALMIPGAILILLGVRQFAASYTLVCTVGYLLFGLGMQYAPGFNRATGALPFGMTVAAIGLVQCCGTFWGDRHWWTRRARDLCLALVVAFGVVVNLKIYFIDYGWSRTFGDAQAEAGWVARQYAGDYRVHLVDWPLLHGGWEGQRLILGDLPVDRNPDTDSVAYVNGVQLTGADLFVLDFEDRAGREALLARFPEARLEVWRRHPTSGPVLALIFVGAPRSASR